MLIEAGPRGTIGNIEYTTNALENISKIKLVNNT